MNARGYCKVSDARRALTLYGTPYVQSSRTLRKMKFIFYIYTLILHLFFFSIRDVLIKLMQSKRRRKIVN